jgi:hypothetical protein
MSAVQFGQTTALNRTFTNSNANYTISLAGRIPVFSYSTYTMGGGYQPDKVLDVLQWGNVVTGTLSLKDATALTVLSATDSPNAAITTITDLFNGCTALTDPKFANWNFASITAATDMLGGGVLIDKPNYANFLIQMANTSPAGTFANAGITIARTYNTTAFPASVAARATLITRGWTGLNDMTETRRSIIEPIVPSFRSARTVKLRKSIHG